jgi:hypothetical protein
VRKKWKFLVVRDNIRYPPHCTIEISK